VSLSGLLDIKFERIILDEAHTVRNPYAAMSLEVYIIHARKRWGVTGNPLHNKLSDFYSCVSMHRYCFRFAKKIEKRLD
jgi:SNF2 family DNA or RNA helicase